MDSQQHNEGVGGKKGKRRRPPLIRLLEKGKGSVRRSRGKKHDLAGVSLFTSSGEFSKTCRVLVAYAQGQSLR